MIRFDAFELNPSAYELRKGGVRLPLQHKPFRLLVMLLERPGEVVTREELIAALWPDSEYGEFDVSINQAVKRVRRALGDSATQPRWIETIPRVGYRFIGVTHSNGSSRFAAKPPQHVSPAVWAAAFALLLTAGILVYWLLPFREESSWLDLPEYGETFTKGRAGQLFPSVSPSGDAIVYSRPRGDSPTLDIVIDGIGSGRPVRITRSSANDYAPVWSPDGTTIALVRQADRFSPASLWVIPAGGGTPRLLRPSPGLLPLDPGPPSRRSSRPSTGPAGRRHPPHRPVRPAQFHTKFTPRTWTVSKAHWKLEPDAGRGALVVAASLTTCLSPYPELGRAPSRVARAALPT